MSEGQHSNASNAGGKPRDWLDEAEAAYAAGDGERAIYAAREALATKGDEPRAWEIRARSSFALERYSDAEFEAREVTRLAPSRASGHEILAGVYELQQRFDEATREAQTAIRLEPTNPMNQAVLGSIHFSRGDTASGRSIFEKLVERHPQEELFQRQLADALDDEITNSWTRAPDGSRIITTVGQIQSTRTAAARGLALQFDDDQLRQSLRESLAAADLAESKRWRRPRYLRAYLITAFLLFVLAVSATSMRGLGVLVTLLSLVGIGLLIWMYVRRHYKPVWQLDAEVVRRTGPR